MTGIAYEIRQGIRDESVTILEQKSRRRVMNSRRGSLEQCLRNYGGRPSSAFFRTYNGMH